MMQKEERQLDVSAPGHSWISEPLLRFHPVRADHLSNHPLDGLSRFGPFGQTTVNRLTGPIRVALVAPESGRNVLASLLKEMESRHSPKERRAYLREFAGFSKTFRVNIVSADSGCQLILPDSFDVRLRGSDAPHLLLARALTRAVNALSKRRLEFDVAVIYLPDKWSSAFVGPEGDDFDLHDYLKAITAGLDLPIQIINEGSALSYFCRCSVMWRLGIALYAKAGGVPWKLAVSEDDVAFIGVSYAIRSGGQLSTQFVTCCSQVFDADGTGLEFVAYSPEKVEVQDGRNPFLSRGEMRRVMCRSLSMYQRRHGGRSPRRVVVQKTTEFKPEEIEGCFDALGVAESVELIQVQQDTGWKGILLERPKSDKAMPGAYPLLRGTYMALGHREVLLWSQGDVPDAVGGRHFYKEGRGIPSPLILRRFAGHGGWEQACRDTLGLSKMNWNSDSLYDRLPVTIGFAQTLANVVKRMPSIADRAYAFRLFM